MRLEELINGTDIEDVKTLLAEVKAMKAEIEALKVQRSAVVAAIDEVDALQEDVASRAKKIKHHLKDAL